MHIKEERESSKTNDVVKEHNSEKNSDGDINPKKLNIKSLDEIPEKFIKNKGDNSFTFNGKIFKKDKRSTNYIKKNNIIREVYKCEHNRHEEKLRQELKLRSFCNATIEYTPPNQKEKSKYILKQDHSNECEMKYIRFENKNNSNIYNSEH